MESKYGGYIPILENEREKINEYLGRLVKKDIFIRYSFGNNINNIKELDGSLESISEENIVLRSNSSLYSIPYKFVLGFAKAKTSRNK